MRILFVTFILLVHSHAMKSGSYSKSDVFCFTSLCKLSEIRTEKDFSQATDSLITFCLLKDTDGWRKANNERRLPSYISKILDDERIHLDEKDAKTFDTLAKKVRSIPESDLYPISDNLWVFLPKF